MLCYFCGIDITNDVVHDLVHTSSFTYLLTHFSTHKICSNYRIHSIMNHPSNILLTIILNRLPQQVGTIIVDNQADFKSIYK